MTARPTRPKRVAAGASIAVAALLLTAACTSDGKPEAGSTTPAPPSSSSAKPTAKPAAVDPLTGGKPNKNGVIAVKIDDTENGRPQHNIDQADVVYIEEVEGGLTRLVGVFHTTLPVVESVRSTRPADPELMSQYGKIGYVASGGSHVPLALLHRSYLKANLDDANGVGFSRAGDKPAPYNLTADLKIIAKKVKPAGARDVGFDWSSSTKQLKGAPGSNTVSTMVGGTPVTFRYNPKTHRYTRYIGNEPQRTAGGKLITTPNVLVQLCKVEEFGADRDVLGNPNQFTHTVGSGKVVLFRDGKRVSGTWKRGKVTSGTLFRTTAGKQLLLRPGGLWVVLTKNGTKVG